MTGHALSRRLSKIGTLRCLIIMYALFVLIQMVVNGYCKHLETYEDEWIYYGIAQSLAKGMGFPAIYGDPYTSHTRYLYSLLIAPGLLVSSRLLQFRLIAMLNALMIGSGVFPTYLLGKRVLKEDKLALVAGLIYLVLPDMEFTATFMTENLWLPVSLWTIWFFYRLVDEENVPRKSRIVNIVLLFVFAAALVNIKGAGIPIVIALGVYFAVFRVLQFVRGRRGGGKKTKRLMWGILIGVLFAVALVLLNQYQSTSDQITSIISRVVALLTAEPSKYAWCYIYTWATEILAVGIFPIILPLISLRKLNVPARRLLVLTLVLAFIANVGVTYTSLRTTEIAQMADFRLHQRYVAYLWILYVIPFLYALSHKIRLSLMPTVLCIVATFAFCIAFQGAIIGSAMDTSLLYWARDWMLHRKLWVGLVVLFVGGGLLLLRVGHKKVFCLCFFGVMIAVVAYDHYAMHGLIQITYEYDYSGIEQTEEFIRENPGDTFLVVTLPNKVDYNDVEVHYNAKVADTFLVYPNTIFASGKRLEGIQTDQGIDLAEVGMDDTGISIIGPRKIESVDYVVLTTEMSIDESGCEKVLEDGSFGIYRLSDRSKIPHMQSFNNWYLPGTTMLQPEVGFASNYYEGDNMVFVSGEKPDYVLRGPGASLKPGRYTVTVHYTYEGDAAGKIGTMDLVGSILDSSKLSQDVYADQTAVTITFDVKKQCDAFEVRLKANVPGVRIDSIGVEMLALVCADEDEDVVYQYVNSDRLIVREERYSSTGEKVEGPKGYFAIEYSYLYGNRVSDTCFDTSGQHVMNTDGYAMVRREYNAARQVTRQEYFDVAGEQVERPEGFYVVEYAYDEKGRVSREEFFGINGEPVIRAEGYHAVEYAYDEKDRYSRLDYYGTDGEPLVRPEGYHAVECAYDEEDRYSRLDYYDKDGGPADLGGYSSVEYDYDADGTLVHTTYFNAKNESVDID